MTCLAKLFLYVKHRGWFHVTPHIQRMQCRSWSARSGGIYSGDLIFYQILSSPWLCMKKRNNNNKEYRLVLKSISFSVKLWLSHTTQISHHLFRKWKRGFHCIVQFVRWQTKELYRMRQRLQVLKSKFQNWHHVIMKSFSWTLSQQSSDIDNW